MAWCCLCLSRRKATAPQGPKYQATRPALARAVVGALLPLGLVISLLQDTDVDHRRWEPPVPALLARCSVQGDFPALLKAAEEPLYLWSNSSREQHLPLGILGVLIFECPRGAPALRQKPYLLQSHSHAHTSPAKEFPLNVGVLRKDFCWPSDT